MEEVYKFYDLVDKTLALRDGMPIQRFFLYCSKGCDYDRVHDWLRIAVQCKVQIIVLRFPPENYSFRKSWDLFKTCDTLVELSLEDEFRLDASKVEVFFPCLKKISLLYIGYLLYGDESVENLISGCPVLEELCRERNFCDDLETLKVSSKSLKILRMYFAIPAQKCKVSIDAPRLEYLYIDDELCTDFSFTKKPLSLVEAHIDTGSAAQIAKFISAAKVLTLTFPALWEFRVVDEVDEIGEIDEIGEVDDNVPIFPNLIKLVIGIDRLFGSWNDLLHYLNNMPNLEHITFLNLPPFDVNQEPPLEAPACLRFRVKEIILRNQETIRQRELAFIEFLLEHSNNLERFTMNVRENDSKTREKLLNSYSGSNRCQFEFVPGLTW
ncbi:F-box/RNI-like superfamily protein [Tanacetum coccineum]